ncbi:MAG: hypothetical protein BJ554DRAFT_604 [Olpidium bornovanus]|uniref:Uncharacterized protein n=1 Tax=Olpidium bornovanus TaxID=278681 RepID=A0A8H7ZTF9_9FUNG|nr:MAG: hypothetical protein BJ554DRAFT_604 [Olpidium bornovanus]
MASPVAVENRTNTSRPASATLTFRSLANRLVLSKASLTAAWPAPQSSSHASSSAARATFGISTTGPRVIASATSTVLAPPLAVMALQPRDVLAARQPSVVAIEMW